MLACSQPGMDILIDAIPLHEVTSVQSVQDHEDVANQGEHIDDREAGSFLNVLGRTARRVLSRMESSIDQEITQIRAPDETQGFHFIHQFMMKTKT